MKVVLACEGNCEVELLSILLEKGQMVFDKQEILDHRPIKLRQPKKIAPLINTLPIDEDIVFYRIGDTQRDDFDISYFELTRANHMQIKKICTMPEIEILIIINERKYDDYLKNKSDISPKEYVKTHLKYTGSFSDYLVNHDMVWSIKEYKRIKNHKQKDEYYLADLLK